MEWSQVSIALRFRAAELYNYLENSRETVKRLLNDANLTVEGVKLMGESRKIGGSMKQSTDSIFQTNC